MFKDEPCKENEKNRQPAHKLQINTTLLLLLVVQREWTSTPAKANQQKLEKHINSHLHSSRSLFEKMILNDYLNALALC